MHSDTDTIVACLRASPTPSPATLHPVLQPAFCLTVWTPDSGLWTLDSDSLSFIEAVGLLFGH